MKNTADAVFFTGYIYIALAICAAGVTKQHYRRAELEIQPTISFM